YPGSELSRPGGRYASEPRPNRQGRDRPVRYDVRSRGRNHAARQAVAAVAAARPHLTARRPYRRGDRGAFRTRALARRLAYAPPDALEHLAATCGRARTRRIPALRRAHLVTAGRVGRGGTRGLARRPAPPAPRRW